MIESDQGKSQLDNSMQCEAVRVDDAIEETKSIDRKCVEKIKSNVKKSSRSKVEGNDKKPDKSNIVGISKFFNSKNNSKFNEATNENSKMPCRSKSKQENDVEDKNEKANSDTEGDSKLAPKPRISLKPVSKLKESSCFGSFLEKIEKTARKRKIGSMEDYKSKRKLSESSKEMLKDQDKCKSAPPPGAVASVPRIVSGILVVERGAAPKKKVQ